MLTFAYPFADVKFRTGIRHSGQGRMVSLGKFLNHESPARFVKPLLAGIAESAIETESGEAAAFRKQVESIARTLEAIASSETILAKIGEVVALLKAHNQRVYKGTEGYQSELRSVLSQLLETIEFLSSSSVTALEQLSSIEKTLESASTAAEVKTVRNKLSVCLALVRNESSRLRLQSEKKIKDLKAAVVRASTHLVPCIAASPHDPVTGLAGADAVRQLISRSLAQAKPLIVALFMFEQVGAVNRRFGRTAGDAIIAAAAKHLGNELAEFGPVLRWNGPALVLAIEQGSEIARTLESHLRELAKNALEIMVEANAQSAPMRVHFSWTTRTVNTRDSIEEIFHELDEFVAQRTRLTFEETEMHSASDARCAC